MKWSFSAKRGRTAKQSFNKRSDNEVVFQQSGRTAKRSNSKAVKLTNKLIFTTMDVSIVILTLVFLAMFLVPFLTISIMQKVKEHKKRKETHPKA